MWRQTSFLCMLSELGSNFIRTRKGLHRGSLTWRHSKPDKNTNSNKQKKKQQKKQTNKQVKRYYKKHIKSRSTNLQRTWWYNHLYVIAPVQWYVHMHEETKHKDTVISLIDKIFIPYWICSLSLSRYKSKLGYLYKNPNSTECSWSNKHIYRKYLLLTH